MTEPQHLVFFDGECGLCDRTVQWLLKNDDNELLYFAPLQGEEAQRVLPQFDLPADLDSIVYVRRSDTEAEVFVYSNAIGEILKLMPRRWSWMRVAWVIPRVIRDSVYRALAARRIQWFGRVDACQLPDERQARRLLS
jgi:predicted DCC family thiol-disulfide oxidoreductase YuxK